MYYVWSLTRHELQISRKINCILCMLFTNYQASKHLSRTKKVSGIYWTKLSYWSIYYIFRPQPSSPYLDLQETILYFLKHSQETGAILEVPLHTVIFSPKFVSYFNVKGSHQTYTVFRYFTHPINSCYEHELRWNYFPHIFAYFKTWDKSIFCTILNFPIY